MGNTSKEKLANFLIKADNYLAENQYDTNAIGSVKTFLKYLGEHDKDISEYSAEDFREFFNQNYRNPNSFSSVRSKVVKFLKSVGEENAANILSNTEVAYKKDYLKDFNSLAEGIQAARFEKMPYLKYSPETEYCDQLTMGEVILYLAWIGVPQNIIFNLPLSAIDLENKVVHAGKDYSFAGNQKIAETFKKYRNSDTFVGTRNIKGKVHFTTSEYCGKEIIRTKKQTNANLNTKTLLTRLFSNFGFAKSYFNVYRSGQFCRGYEKFKNGIEPDFSSAENLWEYFVAVFNTDAEVRLFKIEWSQYLSWIMSK